MMIIIDHLLIVLIMLFDFNFLFGLVGRTTAAL